MKDSKEVISEEIAVKEIQEYLSNFVDGELNVKEQYPKTLDAVMNGRLLFESDLTPIYTLIQPLNPDSIDFKVTKLTLKTRVKPTSTATLAKGIDLKTDSVRYSLVLIAHIIGVASISELDNLSKKDYAFIQELTPVFM
jgi:hypothetical protein